MCKGRLSEAQHQLFRRSRLRLALWYAGVMGTILALLGLGVYRAIAHAHEVTIDREIKSVADAVHDAIEATVSTPQQLSEVPSQLIPDLCLSDEVRPINGPPHRLQRTYQYDYYIRIIDPVNRLLATGGIRAARFTYHLSFPVLAVFTRRARSGVSPGSDRLRRQ